MIQKKQKPCAAVSFAFITLITRGSIKVNRYLTKSFLFILILSVATLPLFASPVKAADINTYTFIVARPNPVGVGQSLLVTFLFHMPPPGTTGARWENVTIRITAPDGSVETKGPYRSDSVGANWFTYIPTKVGTYQMQVLFPGQTIGNNYYKPSQSQVLTITVQEQPVQEWPAADLPSNYWTRPIDAQYREWYTISGNWLTGLYNTTGIMANPYNPYTKAPNSAHIMWTKPIDFGGLIGGEYESHSYYEGLSYEDKWSPVVIIQGRLYYNTRLSSCLWQGVACVDLRTGEQLWWKNNTIISIGQIFNYDSINQHGGIAYLWDIGVANTTTYRLFDAFTGDQILTLANATTGQIMFGPSGELLVYVINSARQWLALWNSTTCFDKNGLITYQSTSIRDALGVYGGQLRLQQGTYDWLKGIDWNTTIANLAGQSIAGTNGEVVLVSATTTSATGEQTLVHIGYNAKTGSQMWMYNYTTASSAPSYDFGPIGNGVYTFHRKETLQDSAYNLYTGQQIWVTEPASSGWNTFYVEGAIAYGKFIRGDMAGHVTAFDINTGVQLWDYYLGSSGFETAYGSWPIWGTAGARSPEYISTYALVVADGKVYVSTAEHSPSQPLYRGGKIVAIDVETGRSLWNISGWMRDPAIADGYLVTLNSYDNQIYCFGKGPSAITVSAPQTEVPKGTKVLLTGTVTDQSAGAKQLVQSGKFSTVPAVSDESMSSFMEYIYMQKPKPADIKGVTVKLTAIDPNGNFQDIGTTVADENGKYGITWVPPVEGVYHVKATFEGSNSYYRSEDTTYFIVGAAPSAVPTAPTPTAILPATPTTTPLVSPSVVPEPEATTPDSVDIYIIVAVAVIIVVIVTAAFILKKLK
ncbi:MAG: PQQ-binding-like beta-propeller repeat protein [Candidatus Bathyarchaeota archaeon]|nr:PQQ-binding-like beta-propeller repeat protein [Candidatus Bathyarchaeota archaeon]